jgi:hypothetical protein
MRPLRPGPRRRDPARLQPSSCRSPRASGRRPMRASDPDRHLPRPDPGGDRPFSTSTALRAPSVCSRRHPRHPRQSPIHQPRPSAPPEPDHQIPIARRLEDRGFVLRGLSDACQRPKLFTKAAGLLSASELQKAPFVAAHASASKLCIAAVEQVRFRVVDLDFPPLPVRRAGLQPGAAAVSGSRELEA